MVGGAPGRAPFHTGELPVPRKPQPTGKAQLNVTCGLRAIPRIN